MLGSFPVIIYLRSYSIYPMPFLVGVGVVDIFKSRIFPFRECRHQCDYIVLCTYLVCYFMVLQLSTCLSVSMSRGRKIYNFNAARLVSKSPGIEFTCLSYYIAQEHNLKSAANPCTGIQSQK